ncbi:hypothetical protein VN21_05155 [Paraclostridium benzoelyticum]|uniref:Uncharacterized protein n=1 Tax=Paraclostridium benzoelyticum TaxID=1629550 RepID=A0A0M3DIV6_9FIRM|nr:hypothetical protein [Paraclostridium benzoelyticum]KKY02076.1 hypothetical protein VN21_05155 [Paraclostridium benzoelyticum]
MNSMSRFNALKVICTCMIIYNCFNYSITLTSMVTLLLGFIFSYETYFSYKDSGKLDFKSFPFALVFIVAGLVSLFYY